MSHNEREEDLFSFHPLPTGTDRADKDTRHMSSFIRIPKLDFKTEQPDGDALIGLRWIIWVLPSRVGSEVMTSQGVILSPLSYEQVVATILEEQTP